MQTPWKQTTAVEEWSVVTSAGTFTPRWGCLRWPETPHLAPAPCLTVQLGGGKVELNQCGRAPWKQEFTHFELGFSVRLNCHDGKDGEGTARRKGR